MFWDIVRFCVNVLVSAVLFYLLFKGVLKRLDPLRKKKVAIIQGVGGVDLWSLLFLCDGSTLNTGKNYQHISPIPKEGLKDIVDWLFGPLTGSHCAANVVVLDYQSLKAIPYFETNCFDAAVSCLKNKRVVVWAPPSAGRVDMEMLERECESWSVCNCPGRLYMDVVTMMINTK